MNLIALIILAALVLDFGLHALADILNLNMLREELPPELADLYDPQQYRQSQQYMRTNTRFKWLVSGFDLVILLGFWFLRGFAYFDRAVRSLGWGPIATGLLFIGLLALAKMILAVPFSLYETFGIETRFGFNRTTLKTFLLDMVKGLLLTIILGGPLLAGILALFEYAGPQAWWYCWIGVTLYLLVVQYVAPTWIMPLFNKYEPLEQGPLRSAITAYAEQIRFSLKDIYVMDGSRRSSKSNAFFTGFGRNKRIVLFDTLIKQHTVNELVAVLGHEMGHYKKKHLLVMLVLGIAQVGLMFFLLSFFIGYQGLFDAFYLPQKSVYAGLLFFGMLYSPLAFFLGLFIQAVSRKNEYSADRFAVRTTQNGPALADALKKLSVHNLSNLSPHPLFVFLNDSHPPILKRLKELRRQ